MAFRRRRRRVIRAPKGQGRQRLWVISTPGNLSEVEASTGTFSADMIEPSDWEREVQPFTQPSKGPGGARFEAMYLDVMVNLRDSDGQFAVPIPELLVFAQQARYVNVVTDSVSFQDTFQENRVLMYDASQLRRNAESFDGQTSLGTVRSFYSAGRWHLKSKVKLADTKIGVAVRTRVNSTGFNESSVQVAFRALLSVP